MRTTYYSFWKQSTTQMVFKLLALPAVQAIGEGSMNCCISVRVLQQPVAPFAGDTTAEG